VTFSAYESCRTDVRQSTFPPEPFAAEAGSTPWSTAELASGVESRIHTISRVRILTSTNTAENAWSEQMSRLPPSAT
jgi:hypothetical protein